MRDRDEWTGGKAVVRELRERGYDVAATDIATAFGEDEVLRADLTDYGQAVEALSGGRFRRRAPCQHPGARANDAGSHVQREYDNELQCVPGRCRTGIVPVVWASSETTLGLPFDVPPRYAPVDEDHYPLPTSTYALSKVTTEMIAGHFAQWSGIPFVALRFSNIWSPDWYTELPEFWDDPQKRKWNLWGYVDERDVAMACRLALEADEAAVAGSPAFIIGAADTVMNQPSTDLMTSVFPGVPLTSPVAEFGTLLSIDRARRVLSYEPRHSWRDHVSARTEPK